MDPYITLGACSPKHACQVIKSEPHIGVFLPCHVISVTIKKQPN
ncbi:MAG: DUF302 domain-containing protein [Xanthomarina gelatinilytica]